MYEARIVVLSLVERELGADPTIIVVAAVDQISTSTAVVAAATPPPLGRSPHTRNRRHRRCSSRRRLCVGHCEVDGRADGDWSSNTSRASACSRSAGSRRGRSRAFECRQGQPFRHDFDNTFVGYEVAGLDESLHRASEARIVHDRVDETRRP